MTNKKLLFVAGLLAASTLTACNTLKSPHYVGEAETFDADEMSEVSVWTQNDTAYFVKVVDSNTLIAATLEWDKQKNDFVARSFPIIISLLEDHMFLNVKDGDLYTILRIAGTDEEETIVLFTVDLEKMKRDISEGIIKGRIEERTVVMECTKEEQDAYIREHFNSLFAMGGGNLVRRISEEKKRKTNEE